MRCRPGGREAGPWALLPGRGWGWGPWSWVLSACGSRPLVLKLHQMFPKFVPALGLSPLHGALGSDKGARDGPAARAAVSALGPPQGPACPGCQPGISSRSAPLHTWGALLWFQAEPQPPGPAQRGRGVPNSPAVHPFPCPLHGTVPSQAGGAYTCPEGAGGGLDTGRIPKGPRATPWLLGPDRVLGAAARRRLPCPGRSKREGAELRRQQKPGPRVTGHGVLPSGVRDV